jgi:hypothetical protein
MALACTTSPPTSKSPESTEPSLHSTPTLKSTTSRFISNCPTIIPCGVCCLKSFTTCCGSVRRVYWRSTRVLPVRTVHPSAAETSQSRLIQVHEKFRLRHHIKKISQKGFITARRLVRQCDQWKARPMIHHFLQQHITHEKDKSSSNEIAANATIMIFHGNRVHSNFASALQSFFPSFLILIII